MAEVVPFPSDRVSTAATVSPTDGCHVLIFPGVRIERHPEGGGGKGPAAKTAGPTSTPKKDRTGT